MDALRHFKNIIPRWIGNRLCDAVLLAILVAGIAKAADVEAFRGAVRTWDFVPYRYTFLVSMAVPAIEIAIGMLWISSLAKRAAHLSAFAMITGFTLVYVLHVVFADPPSCGCFGALSDYHSGLDEARFVITKNGIMLLMLSVGWVLGVGVSVRESDGARRAGGSVTLGRAASRGFTTLEAVIVALLVAALVALTLPSISHLRGRAYDTASLSNLRQHSGVFSAYAVDWRDEFPYFTDPNEHRTVITVATRGVTIESSYFGAHHKWNYALADAYYNGAYDHAVFYPPEFRRIPTNKTTRYHYACVFLASSSFWNYSYRTGPDQWAPTRQSDVLYPGDKILLISSHPYVSRVSESALVRQDPLLTTQLVLVDGSARVAALDRIRHGYRNGDGFCPGGHTWHYYDFPYGLHTIDGVRGRDID